MAGIDQVVHAVTDGHAATARAVADHTHLPVATVRVLLRRAVKRGLVRQPAYGIYAPVILPDDRVTAEASQLTTPVLQRPPGCPTDAHAYGWGGWFLHEGVPACTACWLQEDVPCTTCGRPAVQVRDAKPYCEWCGE